MPNFETKFYTFRQNNSFGVWEGPINVIVEARHLDEACDIAQDHGVYFDGCESGIDCPCCGDRWHRPWFDNGDEVPSEYGTPLDEEELKDTDRYLVVRYGE